MEKSPDAFRTISEVAEELDVPQHVLRFWESKFHQIKPLKRGGGRRYYRPADVDLVGGIKHLLYGEGYTIKGVQKILREQGVAHVQAVTREESEAEAEAPAPEAPPEPPAPKPVNHAPAAAAMAEEQTMVAEPPVRREPVMSAPPKPAPAGLKSNHLRMLKAALFELSELKMLLETAPDNPSASKD